LRDARGEGFVMTALTGTALAIELVNLTGQRWLSAQTVGDLAEKFEMHDLQMRIQFLTGVKNALRELPVKIFEDADARATLLDAAQGALDTAIDLEDDA
jgi:type III secretion protein W